MRITLSLVLVFSTTPLFAQSGPYTPQVESSMTAPGYSIPPGPDAAIPGNSPSIVEWGSAVTNVTYGTNDSSTYTYAKKGADVISSTLTPPLGADPASSLTTGGLDIVSLGEDGSITLSFASPIANGPGNDFAVYSNGILSGSTGDAYSKFATVSVSSGNGFYSFPSDFDQTSLIASGAYYELFDASNLFNIAGKYPTGFGAPFDLNELALVYPGAIESGALNLGDITQIKVSDAWETLDSQGNEILDAPGAAANQTIAQQFSDASAGFNFGAIAVMNDVQSVPEPSTLVLAILAFALITWSRLGRPTPSAL
jgi:hypothetical protein